ncbi:7114_t:CDS:2 [Funneliformis geosporum]|nr:7114_t:CDS:2 [Funneliformis geosporum]
MKAKENQKVNGVPVANLDIQKQLTKITGTLTSQIQLKGEHSPESYYYSFIRLKSQSIDLPVIFKLKDDQDQLAKPTLKKTDQVELTGHYSHSEKNARQSFTANSYQLLNQKRICKKCSDSDALYNLVENLKEILKLLQDQPIKGRYDEFGQPLYKEGLCSLVDEYHSDEEENEDI